jgi:hypothetical protein
MDIRDRRKDLERPYLRWRNERNRLLEVASRCDADARLRAEILSLLDAARSMNLALEDFMALARRERRAGDAHR